MNERGLLFTNVASATLLLAGALLAALPMHAVSIVQLAITTVAVAAGLYALSVHVPPSGWLSPFKWGSPFASRAPSTAVEHDRPPEWHWIGDKLGGRRRRMDAGPPLPPSTVRLLRPMLLDALELHPRTRIDPTESSRSAVVGGRAISDQVPADWADPVAALRRRVSPRTWAILTCDPEDLAWFRTRRPNGREVAESAHAVLDEIERIRAGAPAGRAHPSASHEGRAT